MGISEDERVKLLNEKIQNERDPKKVADLVDELTKLLDELRTRKPADPAV